MSLEKVAAEAGLRAAKAMFDKRITRKGFRNVEVHLSEAEVAAVFALGWQAGYAVRTAPGREPGEAFRWLAEIRVSPRMVADGISFSPGKESSRDLTDCLHRAFPLAEMSGLRAEILDGPSLGEVMREQGYSTAEIEQAIGAKR